MDKFQPSKIKSVYTTTLYFPFFNPIATSFPIQVVEANSLQTVDPTHHPDVFVICHLLPDDWKDNERKTTIQHNTLTPLWNETVTYQDIQLEDLYSCVLEITLWNHKRNYSDRNVDGDADSLDGNDTAQYKELSHQFLGGARLGLGEGGEVWQDSFGAEIEIWEEMMKHLGMQAQLTIPLRGSMTSRRFRGMVGGAGFGEMMPMLDGDDEASMSIDGEHLVDAPLLRLSLKYLHPVETAQDEKKKKLKNKGTLKVYLKVNKVI